MSELTKTIDRRGMRSLADVRSRSAQPIQPILSDIDAKIVNAPMTHTITRDLYLDSTNVYLKNAIPDENGKYIRRHVETPVAETVKDGPIKIAYNGITETDLIGIVGKDHPKMLHVDISQGEVSTAYGVAARILKGKADVGITTGEINIGLLQSGELTAFSPLYYKINGEPRIPKRPITIIARTPNERPAK